MRRFRVVPSVCPATANHFSASSPAGIWSPLDRLPPRLRPPFQNTAGVGKSPADPPPFPGSEVSPIDVINAFFFPAGPRDPSPVTSYAARRVSRLPLLSNGAPSSLVKSLECLLIPTYLACVPICFFDSCCNGGNKGRGDGIFSRPNRRILGLMAAACAARQANSPSAKVGRREKLSGLTNGPTSKARALGNLASAI